MVTKPLRIVVIDGKKYRIVSSTIPDEPKFDRLRTAFARRGIIDEVNALPPRSKIRHVILHMMVDGSARLADSRMISDVAREMAGLAPAERKEP